ncbi:MAG: hypothetical protein IJW03_02070 [Clostridia bacterium]|nr:hypothetical protein [Clostridia bacterium]
MSDYELYGDYNEVDEPPKKSGVGFIIKLVAITVCFIVVGFIAFRLFAFNHYPRSMKDIYFTDTLSSYYDETGGDIGAVTQGLRAPYDDAKLGNFFAANLIVIEGCGEIQVALRYNTSLYNTLGLEFSNDDLSFSLRRSGGDENASGALAGRPLDASVSVCAEEEFLMYRYIKLVFDGVDFGEGEDRAKWIRLDIEIDGVERDEPFMICIYEDNDAYSKFSDYELSKEEKKQ